MPDGSEHPLFAKLTELADKEDWTDEEEEQARALVEAMVILFTPHPPRGQQRPPEGS